MAAHGCAWFWRLAFWVQLAHSVCCARMPGQVATTAVCEREAASTRHDECASPWRVFRASAVCSFHPRHLRCPGLLLLLLCPLGLDSYGVQCLLLLRIMRGEWAILSTCSPMLLLSTVHSIQSSTVTGVSWSVFLLHTAAQPKRRTVVMRGPLSVHYFHHHLGSVLHRMGSSRLSISRDSVVCLY